MTLCEHSYFRGKPGKEEVIEFTLAFYQCNTVRFDEFRAIIESHRVEFQHASMITSLVTVCHGRKDYYVSRQAVIPVDRK